MKEETITELKCISCKWKGKEEDATTYSPSNPDPISMILTSEREEILLCPLCGSDLKLPKVNKKAPACVKAGFFLLNY